MSMNISLQTVAQQSRATLDTLNAAACAGTVKGRVGIRKDGELIVFKGMQFVLHLKQCQRAENLLKAHELLAPRKPSVASFVSSLKLNGLRLDTRPAGSAARCRSPRRSDRSATQRP
ncbi:hypothetical protein PAQ31011_01345 [Pandoraea aquatica]|uniref:Uncharacterized protein n=1 Tax=Pandoraea aquatica TaxID=2508290 RepID=A0A5E4TEY3_9BURK|nr:hypothetical protein PAQ31011_01345 [Pandoraea aquatica]